MEKTTIELHQAVDAEESYAICRHGEFSDAWRAERGFGQKFEKVWTVELQSQSLPDPEAIDWDAVMDRALEAFHLSDPVITNFAWPLKAAIP